MSDYIIKPYKNRNRAELPHVAVIIPIKHIYLSFLKNESVKMGESTPFDFSEISISLENNFCIAGPVIGAPAAAILLERLIIYGVKKVIMFGCCGALCANIKIGDIVIPDCAMSEEGVSGLYGYREKIPNPDKEIRKISMEFAIKHKAIIHEGGIWSTDAPYMETVEKIVFYKERGMSTVDMESSALMSVSSKREVQFSSLLVVSDELSTYEWINGFYKKEFKKGVKKAIQITIETARMLSIRKMEI